MKRVLGILFGALLFVAVVSASAFAAQYTITDIGGGSAYPQITPTAVNNSGQVVGYYMGTGFGQIFPEPHPFNWTVEDGIEPWGLFGIAWGINSSGEIAGQAWALEVTDEVDNIFWSLSTSFGIFDANGNNSQLIGRDYNDNDNEYAALFGVNDSGEAVGVIYGGYSKFIPDMTIWGVTYSDASDTINTVPLDASDLGPPIGHAFLDDNGTTVSLLPYLQDIAENHVVDGSVALGINDRSDIVGAFMTNSTYGEAEHAFLYKNGIATDIGKLLNNNGEYYYFSVASAINVRDQVVGTAYTYPQESPYFPIGTQAFLYDAGTVTYLTRGLPFNQAGQANAINDLGEVVGYYMPRSIPLKFHAFIWTKAGGLQDLNTLIPANSGWYLEDATGINDGGQIVGYGIGPDGQQHGFLLTPVTTTTSTN